MLNTKATYHGLSLQFKNSTQDRFLPFNRGPLVL